MERSIHDLENSLEFVDSSLFREEIMLRRDFLSKNSGLLDIFNTFWAISTTHVGEDGILTKDGYMKIMYSINVALCGFRSFDDIKDSLEADYLLDFKMFGPMTRTVFYDLLFELIGSTAIERYMICGLVIFIFIFVAESWSEIVDKNFLAALSWALLDSVIDINASPPRLRYIRDVRCIMKISNPSVISSFFLV